MKFYVETFICERNIRTTWYYYSSILSRLPWEKMIKVRAFLVHIDHFWSLYDGQHSSVGLLWGIWIKPILPNTLMLLVWPEDHFGVVYPEKLMKIWAIFVYLDHFWSPYAAQLDFCGRYELIHVPPPSSCYRFDKRTTLSLTPWEKKIKVRAISVHFDHFWSSCYGKHCSVELLWEL